MTRSSTSAADRPDMGRRTAPHFRLRLYVAGELPNSLRARENLRQICEEHLDGRYTLEVVDFLEEPARALQDGVLVTPALVRLEPQPQRTVVGSLSDTAAVLMALDLTD